MRAGGLEVRRFALRILMDVEGMLARRQGLDVQFDFHAMRRFAEHGGSNVLTLGVLDFHGDRFGRGGTAGLHGGNAAGENHRHTTVTIVFIVPRFIVGGMIRHPRTGALFHPSEVTGILKHGVVSRILGRESRKG